MQLLSSLCRKPTLKLSAVTGVVAFSLVPKMAARPSSNAAQFRELAVKAKNVAVITGAGISAESGISTFRGVGGLWRTYQAQDLATLTAFEEDPSLVWEFYHYRREVVLSTKPNPGHYALAEWEKKLNNEGKSLTVITQNIDELHRKAGTQNLIELHGSLFRTLCTKCDKVESNYSSPICESLRNKGAPDVSAEAARIPVPDLPHCQVSNCNGLLRPAVIWFGEALDREVFSKAEACLEECDLCLVIGTSSVVYPAAMFAPRVAQRGVTVAEFNLEETPATHEFGFHFQGPSAQTLPKLLPLEP